MLKLRLLTGPRAGRQLRVSDTKPVSVGRRVGRLRLHDSRVSKKHAQIYFTNGTWVLRDLGSANGTYINRSRCNGLVELETGDVVQMGRVVIKILQADAVGMHAPQLEPDTDGTQASDIGIDAFTASGAADEPAVVDSGAPERIPAEDDDLDYAAIFGGDDSVSADLIDFSEQSKAGEAPSGAIESEGTQVSEEPIEPEPITEEGSEPAEEAAPAVDESGSDLVEILDEPKADTPVKPGTTILTALRDEGEADDEAPELVGLRLDQPPPVQPVASEPDPPEVDDLPQPIAEAEPAEDEFELDSFDEAAVDMVESPEPIEEETPEQPVVVFADEAGGESEEEPAEAVLTDDALAEAGPAEEVIEEHAGAIDSVDADEIAVVEAEEFAAAVDPDPPAEPDPDPEVDAELPAPVVDDEALARARDASLTDSDALADEDAAELDLETAHAELSFEDVVELDPVPLDPVSLAAELWPDEAAPAEHEDTPGADAAAEAEEPVVEYPEPAVEAEAEAEAEAEDELKPVAEAADEPQAHVDPSESADQADDPAEELVAFDDAPQQDEGQSDGFDIDAAFDALSEGLDDSVVLPAINQSDDEDAAQTPIDSADLDDADALVEAQAEQTAEDQPSDESDLVSAEAEVEDTPADETPDLSMEADALAGSQVDVGFIRDALAKLGEEDPQAPQEPAVHAEAEAPADPPSVEAAVAPPEPSKPVAADEGAATHSPGEVPLSAPPGLNPTTLLPPADVSRSHRPTRKGRGYWTFTVFCLLVIAGLASALFWSIVYKPQIAGRPDTPNKPAPDAQDGPVQPRDNKPIGDWRTPNRQDNGGAPGDASSETPIPAADQPSREGTSIAGAAPVPDLFSEGPGVLGSRALVGITVQGGDVELPRSTPRDQPTELIVPTFPGTTDPVTPRDPTDRPTNSPDTSTTAPPLPIDSAPGPDPVVPVDQPARIVFLVDASGSLVDTLPQMLVWLGEAVQTIAPEERFTVIFFKSGQAIQTSEDGLQRASRETLDALGKQWLNPDAAPVLPTGRSNPAKAIEVALGYQPTDLYLLSDESFARYTGGTTRDEAVKLVADALGDAAVKIHGVQFFYKDEGGVLETLSNRYDGTFEFVKEDVVVEGDPIDLLDELDGGE